MLQNSNYQLPETVLSQKVGEETVLLDMSASKYFGLTKTASRVWELIDAGASAKTAHTIATEFQVSVEQAHCDVTKFLASLVDRGLLVPSR